MRMWMTDPEKMCRKHLLGEHVETHMCLAIIKAGKSMTGYVTNNLVEPLSLMHRHEELAHEMARRGYNHKSPMSWTNDALEAVRILPDEVRLAKVDKDAAQADLCSRCAECRGLHE